MLDSILDYFTKPISEHTGYNAVNTLIYAIVALGAAYLMFLILKKCGVKIDRKFVSYILPFILFGSAMRVVTDAAGDPSVGIANNFALHGDYLFGLYGEIASSHLYDYGYLTTTPGIYILVGALTFILALLLHRIKKLSLLPVIGLALFLINLVILLPLMKNFYYGLLVLLLAAVGTLAGAAACELAKVKRNWVTSLLVFSHSLDGAATFVSIDLFSGVKYFEQHVVSNAIASSFGSMFFYYLIKVAFATAAVIIIEKSKDMDGGERNYIYLLLIIFGLAPGVRDLLRLVCGV